MNAQETTTEQRERKQERLIDTLEAAHIVRIVPEDATTDSMTAAERADCIREIIADLRQLGAVIP